MQSLTDLNTYAATSVEVPDPRPARAVFNYTYPGLFELDVVKTIDSTTVSVDPKIDIVEVINYSTANVRYRINIRTGSTPLLSGSSIVFPITPSGITISHVGDVYTLSGIRSQADWEQIKSFTWTLPSNYASCPLWYLTISVIYYDQELDKEESVDWDVYDPRFYYVSNFESTSTLSVNSTVQYSPHIDLVSAFSINTNSLQNELLVRSTLTCDVTRYRPITNMNVTRLYDCWIANQLFSSDIPQIEEITHVEGTVYTIEIIVPPKGEFPTGDVGTYYSASKTYSFSGTISEVNANFTNIYYYPYDQDERDTYLTYNQYKDGVLQATRSILLDWSGAFGVLPTEVFTISSSQTWIPPVAVYKWGNMDFLIVAGGGAGRNINGGEGGGGGGISYQTEKPVLSTSYSVVVGAGGLSASTYSGGQSSFDGYSASGGLFTAGTAGGNSPGVNGSSKTGGVSRTVDSGARAGGGGASATTNGNRGYWDAPGYPLPGKYLNGGDYQVGYTNSISGLSITYSNGGAGGYYNTLNDGLGTNGDVPALLSPGTGGNGAGTGRSASNGQNGIVIIKTHEYPDPSWKNYSNFPPNRP